MGEESREDVEGVVGTMADKKAERLAIRHIHHPYPIVRHGHPSLGNPLLGEVSLRSEDDLAGKRRGQLLQEITLVRADDRLPEDDATQAFVPAAVAAIMFPDRVHVPTTSANDPD
jgi:hypothetical protein